MSIIIKKDSCVLVQGITGKEGQRATEEMITSGVCVSCGVTPGKGGQTVKGKKVFDSVEEAVKFDKHINTSVLYVPPLLVFDAAMEAMHAGITTLIIITENVPIKDTSKLVCYAREHSIQIIGPSSVGVLDTTFGKIGSIGSSRESNMYSKGNVGIISKSGGMCAETALILTQQGIGQTCVVGIGGDPIIGSSFADIMLLFEDDPDTTLIVLFGEIGGAYEEEAAQMVKMKKITKPVIAYISGQFAEIIPRSLALGHAGAIIENGKGSAAAKKKLLAAAGAIVADYHYQIPDLVKNVLSHQR